MMDPVSFLIRCATHAAGNQLRAVQRQKEEAEAVRAAAREKAREENDPQYRARRDAERAAQAARAAAAVAPHRRQKRWQKVQTLMFWLSLVCGAFAFLGFLGNSDPHGGSDNTLLMLGWLGFGGVWFYLVFRSDRDS